MNRLLTERINRGSEKHIVIIHIITILGLASFCLVPVSARDIETRWPLGGQDKAAARIQELDQADADPAAGCLQDPPIMGRLSQQAFFSLARVSSQAQGRRPVDENVCLDLPRRNRWCLAHTQENPPMKLAEFLKGGETLQNWSEIITVIHLKNRANADLEKVSQAMGQEARSRCASGHDFSVREREQVSGLPAQVLIFRCQSLARTPHTPASVWGKSEGTVQLILAGRQNLYVLQRTQRGAVLSEATARQWISFLKTARTCDNPVSVPSCR